MIQGSEAGFMRFLDYSTGRFMKDSENILHQLVTFPYQLKELQSIDRARFPEISTSIA